MRKLFALLSFVLCLSLMAAVISFSVIASATLPYSKFYEYDENELEKLELERYSCIKVAQISDG